MEAPFFIYVEGGNNPARKHDTLESVVAEAKRLSKIAPHNKVHILGSLGYLQAQAPPIVWNPIHQRPLHLNDLIG